MKPLSNKILFIFLGLLTTGLLSLLVYLFIFISGSDDKVKSLGYDINKNTKILELSADTSISSTDVKESDTLPYFVKSGEEFRFVELVEKSCVNTNVTCKISSLNIGSASNLSERFQKLSIGLEGKGSFSSVMHFALVLESLPYKTALDRMDLQFQSSADASSTSLWNLNTNLSVIVIK